MAAALPAWPHAAAVTETRVSTCGKDGMVVHHKQRHEPSYVRLHGNLILSHGRSGRAVTVRELDHRVKVDHVADFTNVEVCSKLIHGLLSEAPATSEYDLAADNWVDSICTPRSIATAIDRYVRQEFDDEMGVPGQGLEFHIQLPEIRVTLAYSEAKALLLACKEAAAAAETEAAGASPHGRKRRRHELCPICFLDVETEEEETVRLPCSHPFHDRCILSWFNRAPTCPTCRRDIMKCFSSVRPKSPENEINHDMMLSLFGDEPEDEPHMAEGEQFIPYAIQLFDDESDDEELQDGIAQSGQSIASELQPFGNESED
uniref:Uncharacterized protein n=1 Tax=Avena sativa TaxID=4498 RepID=A0ACD5XGG4_AVESA